MEKEFVEDIGKRLPPRAHTFWLEWSRTSELSRENTEQISQDFRRYALERSGFGDNASSLVDAALKECSKQWA